MREKVYVISVSQDEGETWKLLVAHKSKERAEEEMSFQQALRPNNKYHIDVLKLQD